MKIWICIPVFNRIELTLRCLTTLNAQTYKQFKVIVCNHGSTDGTTQRINQQFPEVIVIEADNSLWWTGAINRCVSYVLEHAGSEDYLLTINNDTEVPSDYLAEFAANINKYQHTVLTSVTHDITTGKLVSTGNRQNWLTAKSKPVTFEEDHLPNDPNIISVTHASGRGTLFPLSTFRQLGLYDEYNLPHYGADYDFSFKARRFGYPIYVCRNCKVFSHIEATGMTVIRNKFSINGLINYYTNIKSPANIKARWWVAWNNCPKILLPTYLIIDLIRITASYFKYFILSTR